MNLDEIETPETDAKYYEFNPAPQGVMVNELHDLCRNLERRLRLANTALEKCIGWTERAIDLEVSGSMVELQKSDLASAREALTITKKAQ
jgi:hypothetical protein